MKKLFSGLLCITLLVSSINALAFSDVTENHWANDYITALSSAEVINGYEDGTFRPEGNVTRAEFAKMLCIAFERNYKGTDYSDTEDHWAKDYINQTSDVIYTAGETYKPDAEATRAEIAYALANVLELDADGDTIEKLPHDWDSVDKKIASMVAAAIKAGIIEGYPDGSIKGQNPVTRAEAAALIVRALDFDSVPQPPSDNDATDTPDNDNPEQNEKPESKPDEEWEHIYGLYPLKHLIIVSSVSTAIDHETDDTVYNIRYSLAGDSDETQYSSVITDDPDMTVAGTKTSLSQLKKGDVIITDTAFYGQISTLYVLASFGSDSAEHFIPTGSKTGPLGSGTDYEFVAGTVADKVNKTKSVIVTIDTPDGQRDITIAKTAAVWKYDSRKKVCWADASMSAIDEGCYIFVRYTDGIATEVLIADYSD